METWYETNELYGRCKIEAVDVLKSTGKTITLCGTNKSERRKAIRSEWNNYFRTWEEAREFLLSKVDVKVANLRRQLELANSEYGNIKGMKKSQDIEA